MFAQTLQAQMKARGLSQAELARRVGVTRQTVSLWLKQDHPRLRSDHLASVSRVLGVSMEALHSALPGLQDPEANARMHTSLLWDRLYPDLTEFAVALLAWEPEAIGRLVQVYGLYASEKVVGAGVWRKFPYYARFIHPVRRRQLGALVQWHNNPTQH